MSIILNGESLSNWYLSVILVVLGEETRLGYLSFIDGTLFSPLESQAHVVAITRSSSLEPMNSLLNTEVQASVYIPLIWGAGNKPVAGSDIPTHVEANIVKVQQRTR